MYQVSFFLNILFLLKTDHIYLYDICIYNSNMKERGRMYVYCLKPLKRLNRFLFILLETFLRYNIGKKIHYPRNITLNEYSSFVCIMGIYINLKAIVLSLQIPANMSAFYSFCYNLSYGQKWQYCYKQRSFYIIYQRLRPQPLGALLQEMIKKVKVKFVKKNKDQGNLLQKK